MPPISVDFWCSGCGQYINKDQVRNLAGVGRMCRLCGSGRVAPIAQDQEPAASSNSTEEQS